MLRNRVKKWHVGVLAGLLIAASPCGGGDVPPGEPDKRSGIEVKPGALCDRAGAGGSYNRVWYICKEDRNGDLRWQKR